MRQFIDILEAFTSPVQWEWDELDSGFGRAYFEVQNKRYVFLARPDGGTWGISFGDMIGDSKLNLKITNDNVPFPVMSTVIAIVEDLVAKMKPKKIYFETPFNEKSNRARVYNRIAQSLVKKYGATFQSGDFGDTGNMEFVITFK